MQLYDYPNAPNPMRVNIFLREKRLNVKKIFVDLASNENLKDDYLKINPWGTVPYLSISQKYGIAESIAICKYFEATTTNNLLFGNNAQEIAEIEMWQRKIEQEGMNSIGECLRNSSKAFKERALAGPNKIQQIPELIERGKIRANLLFDIIETKLSDSSYLISDSFSMADIDLYVTCAFAKWVKIDATEKRPKLNKWFKEIKKRPSIQK